MEEIRISISPLVRQDGRQKIFVSFLDETDNREAEAVIPGCVFIKNTGFSDEELDMLKGYMESEQADIFERAGKLNPLSAFFGKKK